MAYFFGDGFDLYTQMSDTLAHWDSAFAGGTPCLGISYGRFFGSRGLQTINSNLTSYLLKTSNVNDAVHKFVVAIMTTSTPAGSTNGFYITLYDGATAQCTVNFRSDGAIVLTRALVYETTVATYPAAITAANTWYSFEIEIVVHNTTGSIAVRKNGNTVNDFTATGLNTRGGTANNYANKIGLGTSWNVSNAQLIDDFLWRSDASSVPWVGDIRCYTRMPLADSVAQFTRSGSIALVTPYVAVSIGNSDINARYSWFQATCNGTVGTISISINVVFTGTVKCSIFSDAAGVPGAVLGSATNLVNLTIGNNIFTFPTPISVTIGTTYWIGIVFSAFQSSILNLGGTINNLSGSTAYSAGTAYASFPAANPSPLTGGSANHVFTVNITPTTLANANMVNEPYQDGVATYNSSNTVGQNDLYTITPIGITPASTLAVVTRGYLAKSDTGIRSAAVQLKSGSTVVQSTSTALQLGFASLERIDQTDPATGAAWTAAAVNNVLIGPVVTV